VTKRFVYAWSKACKTAEVEWKQRFHTARELGTRMSHVCEFQTRMKTILTDRAGLVRAHLICHCMQAVTNFALAIRKWLLWNECEQSGSFKSPRATTFEMKCPKDEWRILDWSWFWDSEECPIPNSSAFARPLLFIIQLISRNRRYFSAIHSQALKRNKQFVDLASVYSWSPVAIILIPINV
jgi:hypothetical protein